VGRLAYKLHMAAWTAIAALCASTPVPWHRSMARRSTGATAELVSSIGGALLLKEFVLDARYIPSESMEPTFKAGDLLLLDKISQRLRLARRGDVICFSPPEALLLMVPSLAQRNLCCIKRVVAVGGDEVRVRGGRLMINGVPQTEPWIVGPMNYTMAPVRVPERHYFVLGDNRDNSVDSHLWGCLPHELVIGFPLCTYWPLHRLARANDFRRAPRASSQLNLKEVWMRMRAGSRAQSLSQKSVGGAASSWK